MTIIACRRMFRLLFLGFLLASGIGGCGSDEKDTETFRLTVEYHNTAQPARHLADFSVSNPQNPPATGIHRLASAEDIAEVGQLVGSDLTGLVSYDFQTRDYFAVIDIGRCGELVRREAFVKDNFFVYEAEFDFDVDFSCPAVLVLDGFLYDVPQAP